jgi:nucleotide-binding universal stress UspA family protein
MMTLKHVLVATDFGEAADTALIYGRDLARTFGATLHVLHVIEDFAARAISAERYAVDFANIQRDLEETARKQLDALVAEDDRRELGARAVLRKAATPAPAIVSYAKEANIDLIVVGTHGRGTLAHVSMGSVAERVVRTAPCPVLTVRHPQHEFVRIGRLAGRHTRLTGLEPDASDVGLRPEARAWTRRSTSYGRVLPPLRASTAQGAVPSTASAMLPVTIWVEGPWG